MAEQNIGQEPAERMPQGIGKEIKRKILTTVAVVSSLTSFPKGETQPKWPTPQKPPEEGEFIR